MKKEEKRGERKRMREQRTENREQRGFTHRLVLAKNGGVFAAEVVHGFDGAQEALPVRLESPEERLLRLERQNTHDTRHTGDDGVSGHTQTDRSAA